jgi:hypothetical protein
VLIDQQFSAVLEDHVEMCIQEAKSWAEFDRCIDPWKHEAAKIARLREVTLALDVAHTRAARKVVACEWFNVVDKLVVKTPAVRAALRSKWRKKC